MVKSGAVLNSRDKWWLGILATVFKKFHNYVNANVRFFCSFFYSGSMARFNPTTAVVREVNINNLFMKKKAKTACAHTGTHTYTVTLSHTYLHPHTHTHTHTHTYTHTQ